MPNSSSRPTPYEIARQALGHIGRFKTPPTPSVYEVWYRYVEGVDGLTANLSHAVEEGQAVSVNMLEQLHQQYCLPCDDSCEELSDSLASEVLSKVVFLKR